MTSGDPHNPSEHVAAGPGDPQVSNPSEHVTADPGHGHAHAHHPPTAAAQNPFPPAHRQTFPHLPHTPPPSPPLTPSRPPRLPVLSPPLPLRPDRLGDVPASAGVTLFALAAVSVRLTVPLQPPPEALRPLAGWLAEPTGVVAAARAALAPL